VVASSGKLNITSIRDAVTRRMSGVALSIKHQVGQNRMRQIVASTPNRKARDNLPHHDRFGIRLHRAAQAGK